MTGSPRVFALPACLALLGWSLSASAAPAPPAEASDTLASSDKTLAALRAMRYSGPLPSRTGFSAAREVTLAVKGGSDYSTAYRSQAGCAVFYAPMEKGEHDLALRWEGRKCDGQPVRGEGVLAISALFDRPDGRIQQVSVFRGTFENGMLSGRGQKDYFTFDAAGKPVDDVRSFSGDFVAGVLHGTGRKTWSWAASAQPSTRVLDGQFNEGTPVGEHVLTQLHPYPGVEAESKPVVFDAQGRPYLEQPEAAGVIFFTGDTLLWRTKVSTLHADWSVAAAVFFRAPQATAGFGSSVAVGCTDWKFGVDGLRCQEGIMSWQPPGSVHRLRLAPGRPFRVPMPYRTSGCPVRVEDGERFALRGDQPGEEDELTCASDLSSCRGKSILFLGARTYFAGEVEYTQGEVRPVSGLFRTSRTDLDPAKSDERLAWCKELRTPTDCRRGWLVSDPSTWSGAYRFKGVKFDPQAGYTVSSSGFSAVREGHGRLDWAAEDAWAEVEAVDGRLVSVSSCDMPLEDGKYTCRLDEDGVVVFHRR